MTSTSTSTSTSATTAMTWHTHDIAPMTVVGDASAFWSLTSGPWEAMPPHGPYIRPSVRLYPSRLFTPVVLHHPGSGAYLPAYRDSYDGSYTIQDAATLPDDGDKSLEAMLMDRAVLADHLARQAAEDMADLIEGGA